MSDIARLFQQQVPLDSKVRIFFTNGKEETGIFDQISRTHVTLRDNVRNPLAHNRNHVLYEADVQKAAGYCKEILAVIRQSNP